MINQILSKKMGVPMWLRQGNPLVQHHLRQPALRHFRHLMFGSSIGLFALFGGLSLPMLYLLLSLVIFIQLAAGTAERVYRAQEVHTWDLMRVAPFSRREVLLSTWAVGIWQLNRTWTVALYWVLHGLVILGVMIFGLWMGEIPMRQAGLVLLGGTLLIAFQPFFAMYFSGMVGLMCASVFGDRVVSLATAGMVVLFYWAFCIVGLLLLAASDLEKIEPIQILVIVSLPLLTPLVVGYFAQLVAEHKLS
jgi:hypothetical protein